MRWQLLVSSVAGRLAGGLACGLVLTACGVQQARQPARTDGSAGSSAQPGQAASVAACVTSALRISLTRTGSLAEQAGGYLRFTNTGPAACRLSGWPAVRGMTASGRTAPLGHAHGTMYGAWQYTGHFPVLTLWPGQSAYAVVVGDAIPAGHAAGCPAPYRRLEVAPPGSSQFVMLSAWLPGAASYLPTCMSISGASADQVSAIVPLSSLGT
jgi:hypothetical protein